jgi:hypothetical protein
MRRCRASGKVLRRCCIHFLCRSQVSGEMTRNQCIWVVGLASVLIRTSHINSYALFPEWTIFYKPSPFEDLSYGAKNRTDNLCKLQLRHYGTSVCTCFRNIFRQTLRKYRVDLFNYLKREKAASAVSLRETMFTCYTEVARSSSGITLLKVLLILLQGNSKT